jgi:hypothetical protein
MKRYKAEQIVTLLRLEGCGLGELLSPGRHPCAVQHAGEQYEVERPQPVSCWGSSAGHNAIPRSRGFDEQALTERSFRKPVNTGATSTGELQHCCNVLAGTRAKIGYGASGVPRG